MSYAVITLSGTMLVMVLLWDFLKTIVKKYKLNIFPRDGKLLYEIRKKNFCLPFEIIYLEHCTTTIHFSQFQHPKIYI